MWHWFVKKKKKLDDFFVINFDKETSSISVYEDRSLVFLRTFSFGTNSIYRDIEQLCSLKEKEVRRIIEEVNFNNITKEKIIFLEKKFFSETLFKRLSLNHIKDIIEARVNEMVNFVFNKNKNLHYLNGKISEQYLFFEDEKIFKNIHNFFEKTLIKGKISSKIESLILDDFSALSGAAELIFKGWDKEAIPLINRKKSIISSFFERFF